MENEVEADDFLHPNFQNGVLDLSCVAKKIENFFLMDAYEKNTSLSATKEQVSTFLDDVNKPMGGHSLPLEKYSFPGDNSEEICFSNKMELNMDDLSDTSENSAEDCSSDSSDDAVYIAQNVNTRFTNYSQSYVLHTIIEESCEESDSEQVYNTEATVSPSSQLENYFNFALNQKNEHKTTSREKDAKATLNSNSSSKELATSRLEKYFTSGLIDNMPCSQGLPDVVESITTDESLLCRQTSNVDSCGDNENSDPVSDIKYLFADVNCFASKNLLDDEASYMVQRLMMHISEVGSDEPNDNYVDQPFSISFLESQISQLMQRVSPCIPEDPSICSTSSTCSSSTLGSTANNSDCGSDTLESLEDSTDEEETTSDKKLLVLSSTRKLPSYRDHRSYAHVVSQGREPITSDETIYFCQQLVKSLKQMSDNASPDGASEPPEALNYSSELSNAREYIKDQIESLMHSVNSQKRRKTKDLPVLSSSDAQDSSDVESPRPLSKKHSKTHKTPSESGSETTVSASISIPSYDSDCTPTESEISHEMDELFILLEGSNYMAPSKFDEKPPGIQVSMSGTQSDLSNLFLKSPELSFLSNQSENNQNKVPYSPLPAEDVGSKISPSVQCYSLPDIVLAGPASTSQDLNVSVSSIGKSAFDSTSTESIGSVMKAPTSAVKCESEDALGGVDSGVGTPVPSFNAKEKASSENNLLLANYRMNTVKSRVAYAKSASNIADLEANNCNKGSSSCRDTGYYSFKSSEESVQSFDDSVASRASSLTFQRSLTSTETIPEVEEDAPSSISLSSGNIPQSVSNVQEKCCTLPLNLRSRALSHGTMPRPRAFGSSFFSTSGVLRKLTALRAEECVSTHRSSPRGRLRSSRKVHSSSSDDGGKASTGSLPHIVVSDTIEAGASGTGSGNISEKESHSEDDGTIDPMFGMHSRSQISLFGTRSESMSSVYSAAGGGRFGAVAVSGEILLSARYVFKVATLEVYIKECRNLAAVDAKRNRSDPYVKVYLLPDKTKSGKRKTKVKKHSLNPVFEEILKFPIADSVLEMRTMWVSVWHSDIFGRNDFLGEIMLPLNADLLENPVPNWYQLQERMETQESCLSYKGDLILSLQFVPSQLSGKSVSKGSLHVIVKEARNLMATRSNGTSDPFCKSYLLPDKSKSSKQKTNVVKKSCNPRWNHTFIYEDVSAENLKERCLELTIWDYDKITSNDFLGGVRLNLGTGKHQGKDVDWMDAQGEELTLWRSVLDRPNMWIDASLLLRSNMSRRQSIM